jgi:iron complex outermembrane receptor protein
MISRIGISLKCAAMAGTIFASSAALAQTPPADEAATDNGLPEILVTAQRRAESVQSIPLAIQAVQGPVLAQAGVQTFAQLAQIAPSFNISQAGINPLIGLRGISGEIGQIAGEPSVSLSVDGVPLLRQQYLLGAFFDVDRVEVLRGPQGTIAGRNATGGAVNIISKRPTHEFEGSIDATYGNYDTQEFNLSASGGVTDTVAVRFAIGTRDRDGFVRSTLNSARLGGVEERKARASILLSPSDRVEILASADYYRNGDAFTPYINLGLYDPALIGNVPATIFGFPNGADAQGNPFGSVSYYDPDSHRAAIGTPIANDTLRSYGFSLQGKVELNDTTELKSITGYRRLTADFGPYDSVTSPAHIGDIVENTRQHQFSQELTLTSSLGDNIDILIGGQYLREKASEQTDVIYYEGLAGLAGFNASSYDTIRLRSLAAFGQVEWRFVPKLQLTLGARYTSDKKKYLGQVSFPADTAPIPALNQVASDSWKSFTPRVALDFKPTDDITAYASVSKGFKAGGFGTAGGLLGAPQPFSPETVWNYEAGIKTRWFDRTLTLNLTGFWADYKDLQYAFYLNGATLVRNAGKARVRGGELEIGVHPNRALNFGFNATYLDAEFRQFCAADPGLPLLPTNCVDSNTGFAGQDQAGNRLVRAPKWSFTTNLSYQFDLGDDMSLTLRGDYAYQSKVSFAAFNFPSTRQEGYGLFNARAILGLMNDSLQFTVFARNLFDKHYYTSKTTLGTNLAAFDPRAGGALVPAATLAGVVGEPRTYGVTLGYKF